MSEGLDASAVLYKINNPDFLREQMLTTPCYFFKSEDVSAEMAHPISINYRRTILYVREKTMRWKQGEFSWNVGGSGTPESNLRLM